MIDNTNKSTINSSMSTHPGSMGTDRYPPSGTDHVKRSEFDQRILDKIHRKYNHESRRKQTRQSTD